MLFVNIRHLMFVSTPQIRNANMPVASPIPPSQMRTDPFLCGLRICVITVVENHHLNITEDRLHRIIVRASLRQACPVHLQFTHHAPRQAGFARVCSILIQSDPYLLVRIPPAHLAHELTDILRTLACKICPASTSTAFIVNRKQVELPARLLSARQDQALGRSISASAVGFDDDRFDIKEQQYPVAWEMPPKQADAPQNRPPAGVITYDLAPDAAQAEAPFFSNRRRCSRLMAFSRRCLIK